MKALCSNPSCKNGELHKVIEVEEGVSVVCPLCGGHLVPEWAAKYDHPDEKIMKKTLAKGKKSVEDARKKIRQIKKDVNAAPTKNSRKLEDIEFSYSSKLKEISKTFKKENAKKKFDKIDEHIMEGKLDVSRANIEYGEIKKLLAEFKSKDQNSKTGKNNKK